MFKIRLIVLFCIGILGTNLLFGQASTGADQNFDELLKSELSGISQSEKTIDKFPIGNSIDENIYLVGPGDVFYLQINPQMIAEKSITISPDEKLLLPRGADLVDTKGLTLKQLKDKITEIYKKINPSTNVYFTLKQSRHCLIRISGNVQNPNTYTLPSSYRVSTAISIANQINNSSSSSPVMNSSIQKQLEKQSDANKNYSESGVSQNSIYAMRNVTILRKDGTSINVDLEKISTTSEFSNDPYLKEGDNIIVPYEPQSYPKITIAGEVNRPVSIAYKKGDKLIDLIKMAYGFKPNADLNNIYLYRNDGNKLKIETDESLNLRSGNIDLFSGDAIIVGKQKAETFATMGTVSIQGQIYNEGVYPIILKKTKLKDIIELAGGIKETANLNLSYILRRTNLSNNTNLDPRKDFIENYLNSDLTLDDTTRYSYDLYLSKNLVSCDINAAIKSNTDKDNVLLQDGDVIVLPSSPDKVFVYGRVNKPGIIEFVPNKTMEWYIDRAGGITSTGKIKRARVIRGISYVWNDPDENFKIMDGDRIYIPGAPDISQQAQDQRSALIVSIVGAFATLGFLVLNIYNTFIKK